jgi:hypothetical protein
VPKIEKLKGENSKMQAGGSDQLEMYRKLGLKYGIKRVAASELQLHRDLTDAFGHLSKLHGLDPTSVSSSWEAVIFQDDGGNKFHFLTSKNDKKYLEEIEQTSSIVIIIIH